MKKGILSLLIFFVFQCGFHTIGFSKFNGNQGLTEAVESRMIVSRPVFLKPFNSAIEEVSEEHYLQQIAELVDNQTIYPEAIVFDTEMQSDLVSEPGETLQDLEKEEKAVKRPDSQKQKFDLRTGFLLNVPLWVLALLCLFILYTLFISLKFFSIFFQSISAQERYDAVSKDFDSYKRNTIEKERKLMRDLIDAKNRINDLSQEVKNY